MNSIEKIPAKLVLVFLYALVGMLWILFSDYLLLYYVQDIEALSTYQSYKGWAFVLTTTLLLYLLLLWYEKKLHTTIKSKIQTEKKFNLLYEDAPNPYQSLDSDGNILMVNQKWLDLLGYEKQEVIGKWFGEMLTPQNLQHFKTSFANFKKNSTIKGVEYEILHKDGTVIPILLHGQIAYSKNPTMLKTHCSFENISDRVKLEHLNKVLKLIRDVNQAIVRIKDANILFQESCNILMASDLYNHVWIDITQDNSHTLYYPSKQKEEFKTFKEKMDKEWTPSCINLINQDSSDYVYINDINHSCEICPLESKNSVKENAYVLKLNHNNTHYGYLAVSSFNIFDEEELTLLKEVAGDITYGIFNIQTEKILKENEERYRFIVEGATDGLWDWNIISNEIYYSPRWKELLGYNDNELQNLYENWESRIHPDDKEQIFLDVKMSHEGKAKQYQNTHRLKHKDGHWVWILARGQTIFDANGKAIRMVGSHTDITEQKMLEQDLLLANMRFELSEKVGKIGSWEYIIETGEFWGSEQAKLIYGLSPKDSIFTTELIESCIPEKERTHQALIDLLEKNAEYNIEFEIYPLDGTPKKIISALAEVQRDEHGVALKVIGSIQDITERHKLNDLLQNAQSMSHIGSWEQNINDETLFWSKETYRIFEINPKSHIRIEEFFDTVHPDDRSLIVTTIQKSIDEHTEYYLEHRLLFPDGRIKYVIERGEHFYDKDNKYLRTAGSVQDVTEKQNYLNALQNKKRELETILQEAPNPIMVHNEDGEVIHVNKVWEQLSGYSFDEIDTIDKWTKKAFGKKMAVAKEDINKLYSLDHKIDEGEYEIITKSGNLITWQFSSAPLGVRDKKRTVISSAMDITELKRKDEMLINQSRHAAMGEMIGMIAHQWRQPLSVISMGTNNILADIAMDSLNSTALKEYADAISNQTQHLSQTIDDFRNFFKPDKEVLQINIKDILEQTLSIVQDSLKNHNINLIVSFETQKQVYAYPRELMQVFVNIITNAKDAIVSHNIKDGLINFKVYEDEKYINTEICDNAKGIEADILPKIFYPYFSTKDEKTGTGLGLYMSKMIIQEHLNGKIEVLSTDDGACFTVRLLKENSLSN